MSIPWADKHMLTQWSEGFFGVLETKCRLELYYPNFTCFPAELQLHFVLIKTKCLENSNSDTFQNKLTP